MITVAAKVNLAAAGPSRYCAKREHAERHQDQGEMAQ
jgi:hypothetical protein